MTQEELERYYQEIVDFWQVCVDNTSYDDVEGCDFVTSGLDDYDVDSITNSFKGVVITKAQYLKYLEMESLLSALEEGWPEAVEHANEFIKTKEMK